MVPRLKLSEVQESLKGMSSKMSPSGELTSDAHYHSKRLNLEALLNFQRQTLKVTIYTSAPELDARQIRFLTELGDQYVLELLGYGICPEVKAARAVKLRIVHKTDNVSRIVYSGIYPINSNLDTSDRHFHTPDATRKTIHDVLFSNRPIRYNRDVMATKTTAPWGQYA